MPNYNVTQLIQNKNYQSLSAIEQSLSSSVTSSATSLFDSRLKISNLFNKDIIFPTDFRQLNQHVYFGSAYGRTKAALAKIIDGYPIGLSGSATSNLYLEDLEKANNFIANLNEYEFWVLRQLCNESLTSSMSFTANATAVRTALSATVTATSPIYQVPAIVRNNLNFLQWPQGVSNTVTLDNYYVNLLQQDSNDAVNNTGALSNFEQILTTAIAFDQGINFSLKGWSGTGSHNFEFYTYDGLETTNVIPEIFKEKVNRSVQVQKNIPQQLFVDDDQNILDRFLESFAQMYDDIKIYIDGLSTLFKNYWGNWTRLPQGYVQQLVAHQYGIELFSSENTVIKDTLQIRGQYKSQKELTFEFWNRILCSLVYILKTKGTVESIRASARSYGFTPALISIYELASYKSYLSGFYNETRNTSAGKFRRDIPDQNRKVFQSVSASVSGISTSSMCIHMQVEIEDGKFQKSSSVSGLSGTLFSVLPGLILNYKYVSDIDNVSTSGFPYVKFTLSSGTASLTTGYNFIQRAQRESIKNVWNIFAGQDAGTLYLAVGYMPSNINYYAPVITASTGSVTNGLLSPTSVTLGSTVLPPHANISNFAVQNIGYSTNHFTKITQDATYLSSPSGFKNNILIWRMNEYNNLNTVPNVYLLDAGPSSITGAPTFLIGDSTKMPYVYNYDAPAFFDDSIPGFKLQKLEASQNEQLLDKHLRVGISIASPIDTYIHTVFGSNYGQLYANPEDLFLTYNDGKLKYDYSLSLAKTNEIFSIGYVTRNQVKYADFLKFLNRVNGHISSFFNFIEQVIPASKRILEKGIIVENPLNGRIILTKTKLTNKKDNVSYTTLPASETVAIATTNNRTTIQQNPSATLQYSSAFGNFSNSKVAATINASATKTTSDRAQSNVIGSISAVFGNYGLTRQNTFISTVNGSVANTMEKSKSLTGTISATGTQPIVYLPSPQFAYIPRVGVNHKTTTLLYNRGMHYNQINPAFQYKTPTVSSSADYQLQIIENKAPILLRTSATASPDDKRLTGVIYLTDKSGRKISTPYNSVRIDMTDCLLNGLNRVRIIMDGEDMPFNQHIKEFPIATKTGINFTIDTTGAPNDQNSTHTECKVYVENIVNPSNPLRYVIKFYVSDSMEAFSQNSGYSIGLSEG